MHNIHKNFTKKLQKNSLKYKLGKKNENTCLRMNLVVRFYSNAEILHTITKTGYVHPKNLPKRRQFVFQELGKSVNVAVTATNTKNQTKMLRKCCRFGNIYGPGNHRVKKRSKIILNF